MAQDTMPAKENNTMQLAEILSDLVSLRVCDPSAALALVSASSGSSSTTNSAITTAATAPDADDSDPDLQRAKDLLKLHVEVKEAEKRGELSRVLEEARGLVERAVVG